MLRNSKIAFEFLEVTSLPVARTFYEDVLGLAVVENQFNPPHERHGIVKYDAGDTIIALNLADRAFDPRLTDSVLTFLLTDPQREARIYAELQINGFRAPSAPGGEFADADGHRFAIRRFAGTLRPGEESLFMVNELQCEVDNLAACSAFYSQQLGLLLADDLPGLPVRFATGNIKLSLLEAGLKVRRRNGLLPVFYTRNIRQTAADLEAFGVPFPNPVRFSDIGGAVRFQDPSGNSFCLYEPSAVSLTWDSGPKVRQIVDGGPEWAAPGAIPGLLSKWVV